MDSKGGNPKVICCCKGGQGVFNAAHIVDALEAYHRSLMDAVLPSEG
jgi:hypothetical protein